jgi:hypothetical protein
MSWAGFELLRRGKAEARWKMGIALLGCVALSVALAIPFLVIFVHLSYTRWAGGILGSSVVAIFSGMFAPRGLRFPLIFGGLMMGGLLFIIPVGIL